MLESDQAINDIRMKYEAEKQETVNLEKEKVHLVTFLLCGIASLIQFFIQKFILSIFRQIK